MSERSTSELRPAPGISSRVRSLFLLRGSESAVTLATCMHWGVGVGGGGGGGGVGLRLAHHVIYASVPAMCLAEPT